jgi:hypothetical protein
MRKATNGKIVRDLENHWEIPAKEDLSDLVGSLKRFRSSRLGFQREIRKRRGYGEVIQKQTKSFADSLVP